MATSIVCLAATAFFLVAPLAVFAAPLQDENTCFARADALSGLQAVPACLRRPTPQNVYEMLYILEPETDDTSAFLEKMKPHLSAADYYSHAALFLYSSGDTNKSREYLLKATSLGNAEAPYELYQDFLGVDNIEANRFLKLSADRGDSTAEFFLSIALINGVHMKPDIQQGLLMLQKAALAGQTQAISATADYYDLMQERDRTFWQLLHDLSYPNEKVALADRVVAIKDWPYFCAKLTSNESSFAGLSLANPKTRAGINDAVRQIVLHCLAVGNSPQMQADAVHSE